MHGKYKAIGSTSAQIYCLTWWDDCLPNGIKYSKTFDKENLSTMVWASYFKCILVLLHTWTRGAIFMYMCICSGALPPQHLYCFSQVHVLLAYGVCDYSTSCLYQQICTAVLHIPFSQGLRLFTTLSDNHSSLLSLTQPSFLSASLPFPISSSV